VRAFYDGSRATRLQLDRRLGSELAGAAVVIAERVATASGLAAAAPRASAPRAARAQTPPSALVLGGTGFIGRALVERLTRRGVGVRVLSRGSEASSPELAHPLVEILSGDLADPASLDKALSGVSTVYHLARGNGSTWAEFERSDVEPTRRLAAACLHAGVRRLVYTSSTVIFDAGPRAGEIADDAAPCPAILASNHDARAKAECEALLLEQHRREALPVVIARPAIVIGRGSDPFHYGVGDWPHPYVCVLWARAA
jgi:nucleoside-diphosphate-sugar epimerase